MLKQMKEILSEVNEFTWMAEMEGYVESGEEVLVELAVKQSEIGGTWREVCDVTSPEIIEKSEGDGFMDNGNSKTVLAIGYPISYFNWDQNLAAFEQVLIDLGIYTYLPDFNMEQLKSDLTFIKDYEDDFSGKFNFPKHTDVNPSMYFKNKTFDQYKTDLNFKSIQDQGILFNTVNAMNVSKYSRNYEITEITESEE